MDITQGKVFYKPEAGMYLGTVIDVVEFPNHSTPYGPKNKVLLIWTLLNAAGQPALDPENKPLQASAFVTATISDKSTQPLFRNLYKILYGILGQAPPLVTSAAQLEQLVLGRSNGLMLTKEPNPNKVGDFYSNLAAIMPITPGLPIPKAPADFVRAKDRPKTQAGPNGQPVQTYSQNPASPAQYAAAPAAAPQPTPEQIAAFLATQKGNNVGF